MSYSGEAEQVVRISLNGAEVAAKLTGAAAKNIAVMLYLEAGIVPNTAGCVTGVNWFKERSQWMDGSVEPVPGMIIYFDWDNKGDSGPQDGLSDHVGIVEKVEDGYVYTIEGNTSDTCAERWYPIGYYEILGYGMLCP